MLKVSGEQFKLRYPLLGFLAGVAAFPFCLIVTTNFSGPEYGDASYMITFPYGMLCAAGDFLILGNVLFFLQYPVYGLAAGLAVANDRFRRTIIGLAIIHLLTAISVIALNFYMTG
ncbi:MAG TPA: hypothetical protein VGB61_13220 [Pyrinomonadaceae bacterium]|jgi:hypothetical protein